MFRYVKQEFDNREFILKINMFKVRRHTCILNEIKKVASLCKYRSSLIPLVL